MGGATVGSFSPNRSYTPCQAPLEGLLAFASSISATGRPCNQVLVQPSPYAVDNQVLIATLKQLKTAHPEVKARAIAVVDLAQVTDDQLRTMHDLGVRGLRINAQASGKEVDLAQLGEALLQAATRIKLLPEWKLQTFCPPEAWDGQCLAPLPGPSFFLKIKNLSVLTSTELFDLIQSLPVELIADHTGGLKGSSKLEGGGAGSLQQRGMSTLIRLAREKKVFIKISGLYRSSCRVGTNFDDMGALISKLAEEVPDQLMWASDWPHTGEGKDRLHGALDVEEPFREIDDVGVLRNIEKWVGPSVWQKMMVDTPRKVFL
ncbi:hypothetical protein CPAR01_00634 [Colletotrichum paranaense]|uniref:Amidohydrolase-related domain-containing protein n=1 Tax=Colletotrichum paranaense TaxID=1914294 RepID=A0ABQ9T5S3_9PEZI|nr:uncharacterized protein CPAR01_00634 [Colletotrichum paranaense]KAK1546667.1 hypothetical protein CPAR01_00634 [Colletotrichum paranaense]